MKAKIFSKYFVLSVIIILSVYAILLLKQYVIGILFSLICAYFFSPLYDFFKRIFKKERIASFMVILTILLCVIIPATYLMYTFINETNTFINSLDVKEASDRLNEIKTFTGNVLGLDLSFLNKKEITDTVSNKFFPFIRSILPKLFSTISNFFIQIFIFAFILYYLLINKEKVMKSVIEYLPFSHKNSKRLIKETSQTTKALVLGQGMIALIQGTIAAIGFLIFGVGNVFVWWFSMTILSFIPFIGSTLIWLPAGLILIFSGKVFAGVGLLLWCIIFVTNIDNLIRPYIISSMSNLHPVIVLLGVFIGIKEFNILGILIGPLLLSTLLILLQLFSEEYIIYD